MSNGNVTYEGYQKFILPTPTTFFAYAGQKEPCEAALSQLQADGYLNEDFAKALDPTVKLLKARGTAGYRVLLAFGGVQPPGRIQFYTASTSEPEPKLFAPKDNDISYAFLNNSDVDDARSAKMLVQYLERHGVETPEQIQAAQKELNDWVSSIDKSVNTNVFKAIIRS